MNTATPWEEPDWDDLDALQAWASKRRAYLEKVVAASGCFSMATDNSCSDSSRASPGGEKM